MKKRNPYKKEETNVTESFESIQQAYAARCQTAGHLAYQILIMQEEINKLQAEMRDLNVQASKVKEQPAEEVASEQVSPA